jgi:hypothetical protein
MLAGGRTPVLVVLDSWLHGNEGCKWQAAARRSRGRSTPPGTSLAALEPERETPCRSIWTACIGTREFELGQVSPDEVRQYGTHDVETMRRWAH